MTENSAKTDNKKEGKALKSNQELCDFIKSCGWYYLSSADNGKARVRPMGFCMVLNSGKLVFGMGADKRCCKEIKADPEIEICACNADKQWIRLSGTAVFDDSKETLDEIFSKNEFLSKKYAPETGLVFAPYYIENAEVYFNKMDGTCEKWL